MAACCTYHQRTYTHTHTHTHTHTYTHTQTHTHTHTHTDTCILKDTRPSTLPKEVKTASKNAVTRKKLIQAPINMNMDFFSLFCKSSASGLDHKTAADHI